MANETDQEYRVCMSCQQTSQECCDSEQYVSTASDTACAAKPPGNGCPMARRRDTRNLFKDASCVFDRPACGTSRPTVRSPTAPADGNRDRPYALLVPTASQLATISVNRQIVCGVYECQCSFKVASCNFERERRLSGFLATIRNRVLQVNEKSRTPHSSSCQSTSSRSVTGAARRVPTPTITHVYTLCAG